jgi:hypothetical protein
MRENTPTKKFSFGGCDFVETSPDLSTLSPDTPMLNLHITFDDALKLNVAVQECVRKLNSYKRSTVAGKQAGLNIAVHLKKGRITVNEARIQRGA